MNNLRCFLILVLIIINTLLFAQDDKAQYPSFLANSFFGVNIGYINYPFSNANMEAGFQAEEIKIPHTAVKITLLGYRVNKYLSAQITYLRPVNWVEYKNINGDQSSRSVYMNIGGLTAKGNLPMGKKFSLYGEAGLGIITRNGFTINDDVVIKDASFASILLGGGIDYHLNHKWDLVGSFNFVPEHKDEKQPQIVFASAGFRYNMRPLPEERVEATRKAGYSFPKQMLQLAYTTNGLGYGVNDLVSQGAIPIFWGGDAEVEKGFAVNYQRNVFHTKKVFALDIGSSIGFWKSEENREDFFTLSVYPVFRFNFLRTKPADLYFYYSVAGPTFISKVIIDGEDTGRKFTFRDFMGIGSFIGKERKLNAEINIGHFSNGNIFPKNGGVKVPLSFNIGYTF